MAKRPVVRKRRLFDQVDGKMHMPFFDGKQLLFCRADTVIRREFRCEGTIWSAARRNPVLAKRIADLPRSREVPFRAWKLHYAVLGQSRPDRLPTGLPEDAIECCPAFVEEEGQIRVSFIGGIPGKQRIFYQLYEMVGKSWKHLSPAVPAISGFVNVGFVGPQYICYGNGPTVILRDRKSGEERQLQLPFSHVRRVSFRHDDPDQLIITGYVDESGAKSFLFDLSSGQMSEIQSDGPVYKPSLVGDQMIHPRRGSPPLPMSGSFASTRSAVPQEDFDLWQDTYSLEPTPVGVSKKVLITRLKPRT